MFHNSADCIFIPLCLLHCSSHYERSVIILLIIRQITVSLRLFEVREGWVNESSSGLRVKFEMWSGIKDLLMRFLLSTELMNGLIKTV